MLNKLLGVRKLAPFPKAEAPPGSGESLGLRVVHAGGKTECYYMPIPAARIMDKYPSFVVARPDVFRRPWESVIRPEEILTPGQKVLVVPRRTVRKLRRRFREAGTRNSDACESSCDESSTCYGVASGTTRKKQVRFSGIDDNKSKNKSGEGIRSTEEKRKVRKSVTWEPSLTSINERKPWIHIH